jgi:hypothetical protein
MQRSDDTQRPSPQASVLQRRRTVAVCLGGRGHLQQHGACLFATDHSLRMNSFFFLFLPSQVIFSAFLQSLCWAALAGMWLHRIKQSLVRTVSAGLDGYHLRRQRTLPHPSSLMWGVFVRSPWRRWIGFVDRSAWSAACITIGISPTNYSPPSFFFLPPS